jgi:uncharacterized membrane protein (UPF0127 family)
MLELAHTPAQLTEGLMGRAYLGEHQGMLFVFDKPRHYGFWMKNTGIPLDLAWLSGSGLVLETAQLHPYDETMREPRVPALYAVELPGGTFARLGVTVGSRLWLGPA